LLRCIASQSHLLGDPIKIYSLDNTKVQSIADLLLAWTGSRKISEIITLAEYAATQTWIRYRMTERPGSGNNIHEMMLMPPGYARIAALDGTNPNSRQGFVAMWFDPSMTEAYEHGIRPAIIDAGYEAMRIDGKDHNNKIDDEIIAEIRRSRFMVADFTHGDPGARGGVYYEAGFAHGLNMPIIFCCRKDVIEKVHFDTRQYNHIVWETPQELRDALAKRISATIGDGPNKKSS
jgi:nucleoside 2-deoxyribosyltransferase